MWEAKLIEALDGLALIAFDHEATQALSRACSKDGDG